MRILSSPCISQFSFAFITSSDRSGSVVPILFAFTLQSEGRLNTIIFTIFSKMNSLKCVLPPKDVQEITVEDLKYLAPVFQASNDAELQSGIAMLGSHLCRSEWVNFRTEQGSKAVLCAKHKDLSARLTRSMFRQLRDIVTSETAKMGPYEEYLGKEEMDTLRRVRAIEGMWNERLLQEEQGTRGHNIKPWKYQSDSCEACMLARVATDMTALQDLFAMYCSCPASGDPAPAGMHPKIMPFSSNFSVFVCVWIFLSGAWDVFGRGVALGTAMKDSREKYKKENFEMQPKRRDTADASVQADRNARRKSAKKLTKKQRASSLNRLDQDNDSGPESDSTSPGADGESSLSFPGKRRIPSTTSGTSTCDRAVSPPRFSLAASHERDNENGSDSPNNNNGNIVQRADSRRSNFQRNGPPHSTGNDGNIDSDNYNNCNIVQCSNSRCSTNTNNNDSSNSRYFGPQRGSVNNNSNNNDKSSGDGNDNENGSISRNSGTIVRRNASRRSNVSSNASNNLQRNDSRRSITANDNHDNHSNIIQSGSFRRASSRPAPRLRPNSPATEDYRTAAEDNISVSSTVADFQSLPEHPPGLRNANKPKTRKSKSNAKDSSYVDSDLSSVGYCSLQSFPYHTDEETFRPSQNNNRTRDDVNDKSPVHDSEQQGKRSPSIIRRSNTHVAEDRQNRNSPNKLQKLHPRPSTYRQEGEATRRGGVTMKDMGTQTGEVVCAYEPPRDESRMNVLEDCPPRSRQMDDLGR